MISCPPSSANAAEKMPEPTNSQHTIALVLAVRNEDSLTMVPSSLIVTPSHGAGNPGGSDHIACQWEMKR